MGPQDLSSREFVDRFERPRLPLVITGLCDDWKGQERWQEENLLRQYGDHKFKVVRKPSTKAWTALASPLK
jgi:histone arginine demethylase JMJD6